MIENGERRVWGIHTKDDRLFLSENVIAIGWREMGDLSSLSPSREAYRSRYAAVYPADKKQTAAGAVGMLYRFACEAQIGDIVVFPSKFNREVNIGFIQSGYSFCPGAREYVQQRKVKWLKHLPRTAFSQGALYEVGAAMSFFSVKNYADEFLGALHRSRSGEPPAEEEEAISRTAEEIVETTRDFILKELSKNLKGYALEDFVADLLRAMGYRTEISPRGGDGGIDLKAYKDELPPRIIVQIKSQDGDIRESTIQSLKGAMREGDYGLFVTLSGYTKNAKKYLDNTPIIRGINGNELVDLILKYYEFLSDKYKKMIPLKLVYVPIS